MFDRRLIQNMDWGLFTIILIIAGIGLVTLYSAVYAGDNDPRKILLYKQMIWYAAGLGAMMFIMLFDYKHLEKWAVAIFVFNIFLLLLVLFFGKIGGGSRRWLRLGAISIQPSEFCKIAEIIILARYYAKTATIDGLRLRELVYPAVVTLIPFLIIVKQPDLGTAMLFIFIAVSITAFVKIERTTMIALSVVAATCVPVIWHFLEDYQKQRIMTFLDPNADPLGSGYHIIQSKIAIGSGMLTGRGLLKGPQNALSFLPEQHTDFIFSVFAEEWGFTGSFMLILLFMLLIIWGLNIAYNCRNSFGTILAVGVTSMIFWQLIINIGMVMGLLPVVGVPLPFISYGGSSIVSIMSCVGILLNVSMRRFQLD